MVPVLDANSPVLAGYDMEPESDGETLQNFYEYTLATQVLMICIWSMDMVYDGVNGCMGMDVAFVCIYVYGPYPP